MNKLIFFCLLSIMVIYTQSTACDKIESPSADSCAKATDVPNGKVCSFVAAKGEGESVVRVCHRRHLRILGHRVVCGEKNVICCTHASFPGCWQNDETTKLDGIALYVNTLVTNGELSAF